VGKLLQVFGGWSQRGKTGASFWWLEPAWENWREFFGGWSQRGKTGSSFWRLEQARENQCKFLPAGASSGKLARSAAGKAIREKT